MIVMLVLFQMFRMLFIQKQLLTIGKLVRPFFLLL